MALKSMDQFLSNHPDFDKVSESFRNRRFPVLARLSSAIVLALQTPEAINNFANASPEQKQQIAEILTLEPKEQDLAFHYAEEYAQYIQDYNNRKKHGLISFLKTISQKFSDYSKSPYDRYLEGLNQTQPISHSSQRQKTNYDR